MSVNKSIKVKVQKMGRALSGMVMPNIGAFIAWGLLTALFIPTGWFPNERLAGIVSPMLTYLLPLLVAYTAGMQVGNKRGAVVASIASLGVICGSNVTMFLGVMIYAPLSALVVKKFNELIEGKVKEGFEMLVENFSVGIIGVVLAIVGFYLVGPFVSTLTTIITVGATAIYNLGVLPLMAIFVEPAKVLFLNNAINHGIIGPIGIQQAAEFGKSVMFLIEANPGPGLGILLAYMLFGKGSTKSSAYGASVIHFFGGIHEIYFPYVLMNPKLLLATITGSAAGILTFTMFGVGLVATPSPGSIFALLALCPKADILFMLLGVAVSCAVSFNIAALFVKKNSKNNMEDDFESARENAVSMKKQSKSNLKKIEAIIVFACDAGMGSSAMGATILKKKFQEAGFDVKVEHSSVDNIREDVEYIVTQKELVERAKLKCPNAVIYPIDNFANKTVYNDFIAKF